LRSLQNMNSQSTAVQELPIVQAKSDDLKAQLKAQYEKVKQLNSSALVKGDTWAVVSARWVKLWKEYVGAEAFYANKLGDENYHPGPIDNSDLIEPDGKLKEGRLAEIDYFFMHKEAWDLLAEYYKTKQSEPIFRKVIEKGKFTRTVEVEVYLLDMKLAELANPDKVISHRFSRASLFSEVESTMRSLFKVPDDRETRLWVSLSGTHYELLTDKDQALENQVYNNQYLVLEVKGTDDKWPRGDAPGSFTISQNSSYLQGTGGRFSAASFATAGSGSQASGSGSSQLEQRRSATPGLCGLSNLGNTCFMNSALQALSNVQMLTEYFLSEKWREELNPDNPLGMHGEIARRYGELIRDMWSGKNWHISPRSFKYAVGQFAPQFSGFQQQDGQELMAFLLDGLHEDLNRIKKKPYVELKDADGRSDHVVAKEAWNDYKLRNDSIIVDLFHGQLKSTLICPDCRKVSVTFDPFCYLSLPVPKERNRLLAFFFVSKDPTKPPLKCKVQVPIEGQITDLCKAIGQQFKVKPDHLLVADVYNNKFHKVYASDDSYTSISNERDYIYVYELDAPANSTKHAVVKVYFVTTAKYSHAFGLPIVFSVPLTDITYANLFQTVTERSCRMLTLNSPDPKSATWWKDHSSTKDDEGICDSGEDDEASPQSPPPLFVLRRSNANLTTENDLLEANSSEAEPLSVSSDLYLMARFHPKAKFYFCNEQNAVHFERHSSASMIMQKRTHHLEDCLKLFTEEERLGKKDAWYCPKCKDFKCASKKFDLWCMPKVLVIHLKRFHYDRYYRNKIDDLIEFPTRGLDMTNWLLNPEVQDCATYDLVSVANHYGCLGGGHYTAYGMNYRTGKWHYFDDSSVRESSESEAVTKAAYVLIYVRRDLMPRLGDSSASVDGVAADAASPGGADRIDSDDDDITDKKDGGSQPEPMEVN
ncbi:hypothetical protein BOX15_Mlig004366g1, partial [Macrostomum lignano]